MKTFAGSNILQAISSSPVNKAGEIVTSILSGVVKIVAIGLGVPASPAGLTDGAPPPPAKACGTAREDKATVAKAKTDLRVLQRKLAGPPASENDAKLLNAQIQALQAAIVGLESGLTITLRKTIDPGVTSSDADKLPLAHFAVDPSGLIGTMTIPARKLVSASWVTLAASSDDKSLKVYFYLDVEKAQPRISTCKSCPYFPTKVGGGNLYREVRYIPVLAFHGERPQPPTIKKGHKVDAVAQQEYLRAVEKQLLNDPLQRVAFAQFGTPRSMPFSAGLFENLSWSITFAESGQVTEATFKSKAAGTAFANFFTGTAGAANAIATEQRAALSAPSSETIRLKARNDEIKTQLDYLDLQKKLREAQVGATQ